MTNLSLFAATGERGFIPDAPPTLPPHVPVQIDTETSGLDPFDPDVRTAGLAVGYAGGDYYLPVAHECGGNLDLGVVQEWARRELRNRDIYGVNIKFDTFMTEKLGVNLIDQGCKLHELQFAAALLNSNRKEYTLDSLGRDFLNLRKEDLEFKPDQIAYAHASKVAPYATQDVVITRMLKDKLLPEIYHTGRLSQVWKMETRLIPAVMEMERNGAPIDEEKLERWTKETGTELEQRQDKLNKMCGGQVDVNSRPSLERLWRNLGLQPLGYTDKGAPSFTSKLLNACEHEVADHIVRIRAIDQLRTRYLLKYPNRLRNGLLRYNLHQLRGDWEEGGVAKGTVTGRFSSSNMNIQQVFKKAKQLATRGVEKWPIRELFIAPPGRTFVAADASQIEFRIFAHLSENLDLIAEYVNSDPDFHSYVAGLTSQPRRLAKHITFCRLFGGGIRKIAEMAGVSYDEAERIAEQYDRRFPDVRRLLRRASNFVKNNGFIETILGRRRHYTKSQSDHSALNACIQGTAADIMKLTIIALYEARELLDIVLRFTVHDEECFDTDPNFDKARLVSFLNEPKLPLSVPIKWDVDSGANWAECE